jgi:2-dehydro-3-deoxygalactonokinase
MLIDDSGRVLGERSAPGIARLSGASAIEAACFQAIDGWPALLVVMAGMVGSNIGWGLAPYADVPASPLSVAHLAVRFAVRDTAFVILAGVATNQPDVMRGEETQIFGAARNGLICLPGTHAKWALVEDGVISTFFTAMTGELIDILGRHSILLKPQRAPIAEVGAAFLEGVSVARSHSAGLEVLLFSVRSRQIAGMLSDVDAEAYLAGLCIGADVRSALAINGGTKEVTLVGSAALNGLYGAALDVFGVRSCQIDGQGAVVNGLLRAYRMLVA